MSTFEQVKQNIEIAEKGTVGHLTAEEQAFVEKLQRAYDESQPIKCTKCAYCTKDCPVGVDIPYNFECYNNFVAAGATDGRKSKDPPLYKLFYDAMKSEQRADQCTKCGNCEKVCPQKLDIQKLLAKTHKTLG